MPWEGVAASLPAHFAEPFWRHPRRAALRPEEPEGPRRQPRASPEARRLADINQKLRACARTEEVLSFTMDSAVELTGAERGFVILAKQSRHEPELEVAVARNIDREDIHRSHLKFSKGIADRVILTGDVVVCHDALVDERFAENRSVHAMRPATTNEPPRSLRPRRQGALAMATRMRPDVMTMEAGAVHAPPINRVWNAVFCAVT